MANSKSALKRVRQNHTKEVRNTSQVSKMRTYIKEFRQAAETGAENLNDLYKRATQEIDRTAGKGLIHQNKAARDKAKLAGLLNK